MYSSYYMYLSLLHWLWIVTFATKPCCNISALHSYHCRRHQTPCLTMFWFPQHFTTPLYSLTRASTATSIPAPQLLYLSYIHNFHCNFPHSTSPTSSPTLWNSTVSIAPQIHCSLRPRYAIPVFVYFYAPCYDTVTIALNLIQCIHNNDTTLCIHSLSNNSITNISMLPEICPPTSRAAVWYTTIVTTVIT